MKDVLLKGVLLIGLSMQALALSASAAKTEDVSLRDGRTYNVPTQDGMPVPFKSGQIEVKALGPVFSRSGKGVWWFHANLVERGMFTVTVATPLNASVSTTFECVGPGEIKQLLFSQDAYPALWEWYEEPSTSWVPMEFTFTEKASGYKFKVTQWTKFDAAIKVELRRKLKEFN